MLGVDTRFFGSRLEAELVQIMESLVKIESSNWSLLQDIFRENWPRYVVPYMLLDTHIRYPELTKLFQLKVYCPYGNFSNGIVAIKNYETSQDLIIYPLNNTSAMEECLRTTKLINWDKPIEIQSTTEEVLQMIMRLCSKLKIKISTKEKVFTQYLDTDTKIFTEVRLPVDTYVGQLVPKHLGLVNSAWPYKYSWSQKFFKCLMNNGLTYALYSMDHEPLAWITYEGVLTHLHCVPEHRNKGYAEFITKHAINCVLDSVKHIVAYNVETNVKSQKLFSKLGFKNIGHAYFTLVEPK
ncbi:unnamed protein product [Leptosia nina]|uniref:Glycine N-acyltransferase-like protein n=1 Tax=Leptosia nina TaxID=320188 RepID=A0AAV1JNI0_9NEOP